MVIARSPDAAEARHERRRNARRFRARDTKFAGLGSPSPSLRVKAPRVTVEREPREVTDMLATELETVAQRGTAGWWFLDLGFAWLAWRSENDTPEHEKACGSRSGLKQAVSLGTRERQRGNTGGAKSSEKRAESCERSEKA